MAATPIPDERATLSAFARELAAAGQAADLQGTVVHLDGARVVATHCALAALASLVAVASPLAGLAGLALVGLAAAIDLDGGRSWARGFGLRSPSRNLVWWPRGRPRDPAAPVVLLALPADAARVRAPGPALALPLAAFAFALAGAGLLPWSESAGRPVALWGGAALLASSGGAWLIGRYLSGRDDARSGVDLARRLAAAIDDRPPRRASVAIALIGGGTLFHDGVEVLLRNRRPDFPPDRTCVIAWQPAKGELRVVDREGLLRRLRAEPALLALVEGMVPSIGRTAAGRARRAGWRGIGFFGGTEVAAAQALHRAALAFDRLAGG